VGTPWKVKEFKDGAVPPSVLLADDDAVFRAAVQKFLEPQCEVVASVGDGQAALEVAQRLAPDVAILDISMPILNGIHTARRLKSVLPDLRIIFLSVHEDPAFILEAGKVGAAGYVVKRHASTDLVPAIAKVLEGKVYFPHLSLPGAPPTHAFQKLGKEF
jgi:DNA-binding NarL/FixJ family response regulator